jgi:hypothetical protein
MDHPAAPAGQCGFAFDRSGRRVPAIIVSPWIDEATVINEEFRHTSLLATARQSQLPVPAELTDPDHPPAPTQLVDFIFGIAANYFPGSTPTTPTKPRHTDMRRGAPEFTARSGRHRRGRRNMIANSAVYRDGSRLHTDVKPDDLEGIREAVRSGPSGGFASVGLHEPDEAEMARVAGIFGFHRLAVEDSLHPAQRPKVEQYGDMTFLVLKTLWYAKEPDTVESGQVALFMGPDYVVTVRQGAGFDLSGVRHDLEGHADVLSRVRPPLSTPSATGSWTSTSCSSRI